ncbi:hypothetical protein M432DRAFT_608525 [Thermoascus aurantiacus ATCC 26904]
MAPFKVIIAGGGVVGLFLALCLEQAGIDYVLFEKGEIGPELGASISLHPASLKTLGQLGVAGEILSGVVPLRYRLAFNGKGKCFDESWAMKVVEEKLGGPIIFMGRCEFLRILYKHIRDKSRVLAQTAVVSYEEDEDGITVTASDGMKYCGDILVGTDGVHSTVAQLMTEKLNKEKPSISNDFQKAFTCEYKCVFGISHNDPSAPFLAEDGVMHYGYYDKYTTISCTGVPGQIFWFMLVKIPLIKGLDCPRFTEEDTLAVIEEYGDVKVGPGYTIKDLWNKRIRASMVSLEEGILQTWHHSRVILMGDAIHKTTPNYGQGANLAYESVARLTNLLHSLLQKNPNPTLAEIKDVFETIDRKHRPRAKEVVKVGGTLTRIEAHDNRFFKVLAQHVLPRLSDKTKLKAYFKYARQAPTLDFLPLPQKDEGPKPRQKMRDNGKGCQSRVWSLRRFQV